MFLVYNFRDNLRDCWSTHKRIFVNALLKLNTVWYPPLKHHLLCVLSFHQPSPINTRGSKQCNQPYEYCIPMLDDFRASQQQQQQQHHKRRNSYSIYSILKTGTLYTFFSRIVCQKCGARGWLPTYIPHPITSPEHIIYAACVRAKIQLCKRAPYHWLCVVVSQRTRRCSIVCLRSRMELSNFVSSSDLF